MILYKECRSININTKGLENNLVDKHWPTLSSDDTKVLKSIQSEDVLLDPVTFKGWGMLDL